MWRADTNTERRETWRQCRLPAAAFAASAAIHAAALLALGGLALGGFGARSVISVSLLGTAGLAEAGPGEGTQPSTAPVEVPAEGAAPPAREAAAAAPAPAAVAAVERPRRVRNKAVARPPLRETRPSRAGELEAGSSISSLPGPPGADDGAGRAGSSGGSASSGASGRSGGASDRRPSCEFCPSPNYPWIARARGWQGTADVGLRLATDGSVKETNLRRSTGYEVLDAAAIEAARRSRFRAPAGDAEDGDRGGFIEYRFELSAVRREG